MNINPIKNHVLKNKEEILKAYAVSIERRVEVVVMKEVIEKVINEVLSENDYKVLFGYDEVVGFDLVKDAEYIYFIDNDLSEKYNKAFYDKVKNNKEYYEFFNLEFGSYHDRMGYYQADRFHHFENDKHLVDLVRSYSEKPFKNYDADVIEKELKIIGDIVKFLK